VRLGLLSARAWAKVPNHSGGRHQRRTALRRMKIPLVTKSEERATLESSQLKSASTCLSVISHQVTTDVCPTTTDRYLRPEGRTVTEGFQIECVT
jgi:hypothetical protein